MKKIFLITGTIVILSFAFTAWKIFGPSVSVTGEKYFFIRTGDTYPDVKKNIIAEKIAGEFWFDFTAKRLKYHTSVKPGRYRINDGMSLITLLRMLRNGSQSPVNLVITKLRTKEDLARKTGILFECDSTDMIYFLNSPDSLNIFGLDTLTALTAVIPDTYTYFWNTTPRKIFQKLVNGSEKFWTPERKEKAVSHGLTPVQAYILASIVEEETRMKSDKGNIASVYINRLAKGMPLQADPTVKFAVKDFSLRRVYQKHLETLSPYNTYLVKGLPPGPICTPSAETIDEVLHSPKTGYYYFVASSKMDGSSVFSSGYKEHIKYAQEYRKALDVLDSVR